MNFCKNSNQCNTELCQKMQTKSIAFRNQRKGRHSRQNLMRKYKIRAKIEVAVTVKNVREAQGSRQLLKQLYSFYLIFFPSSKETGTRYYCRIVRKKFQQKSL